MKAQSRERENLGFRRRYQVETTVVTVTCDFCGGDADGANAGGVQGQGDPFQFTILDLVVAEGIGRRVDICKACGRTIRDAVAAKLMAMPRAAGGSWADLRQGSS